MQNRLARETSPYLLMHAHNPVDWFPWGEEAFAKAKAENKLVFLSIGYSSCYWCHVMERQCFENAQSLGFLNQWFISIKVDREERPDIDSTYMTSLHVLGQSGGWPLSMFLTANGKPIVGGTYWPTEDARRRGRKYRGFKSILKFVHDWQGEKPQEVARRSDALADATATALVGLNRAIAGQFAKLTGNWCPAHRTIKEEFDKVHGGFGSPARKMQPDLRPPS